MGPSSGSSVRASARLVAYFCWTWLLIPVQAAAVIGGWRLAERLPVLYHRVCQRILGFTVEVRGHMSTARPTLFVCNHASYLDVAVLGGLIPGSFIAKSDVARWPLFGLLAKLQRTLFIDRERRSASNQRDAMQRRLDRGDNLILFPEATSNDGNRVLPFKSALFSVAERLVDGQPLQIQPVSIAYARLNGIPLGYALRPFFAWYGDMSLAGHLWRMLGFGLVKVVVEFHPVVVVDSLGTRRLIARHCHEAVSRGVAAALSGRPRPLAA